MLGDKAGIGRFGGHQVAQQQARGKGQDQREGDLGGHERAARPLSAAPGGHAGAVFQSREQIQSAGSEHRHNAGKQSSKEGDGRGKQQHAPIVGGFAEARNLHRFGGDEGPRTPLRQQPAGSAAQSRQQQIL